MSNARCVCGRLADGNDGVTCGNDQCQSYLRGWGLLVLQRNEGGWRHYLCGEPVHCGTVLLLQAKEGARDMFVRYESPLFVEKVPPAQLFVDVRGHTAVIIADSGKLLRWPYRGQREQG